MRVERARRLLRWSPSTSLDQGLRLTYEWLRRQPPAPSGTTNHARNGATQLVSR
jgi:hypothetical protein